jgi:hypothetical protein
MLPTAWHQAPVLDLHETDHPNPQVHDPQFTLAGRTHRGMRVRSSMMIPSVYQRLSRRYATCPIIAIVRAHQLSRRSEQ